MFLNALSIEQKKTFLAIALKMVGSDRKLDPRERQLIEAMRYEMGLYNETDIPKGSIEELIRPFDSRKARVACMLEAISLAYIDEQYAEEEKLLLRAMALGFNFTEEEATTMENWVLRYKDMMAEAKQLMNS